MAAGRMMRMTSCQEACPVIDIPPQIRDRGGRPWQVQAPFPGTRGPGGVPSANCAAPARRSGPRAAPGLIKGAVRRDGTGMR